eukprot:4244414-Pyramimonas_sp.AAC.1
MEVAKDEPSELERNGRWPTDDAIYYLMLRIRAPPIAQDPSFSAAFKSPASDMMAACHPCPRRRTFRVWLKLMLFGIALSLVESCNAAECQIAQDSLKTGGETGDYEALYAYFQVRTGTELNDPSDPRP